VEGGVPEYGIGHRALDALRARLRQAYKSKASLREDEKWRAMSSFHACHRFFEEPKMRWSYAAITLACFGLTLQVQRVLRPAAYDSGPLLNGLLSMTPSSPSCVGFVVLAVVAAKRWPPSYASFVGSWR